MVGKQVLCVEVVVSLSHRVVSASLMVAFPEGKEAVVALSEKVMDSFADGLLVRWPAHERFAGASVEFEAVEVTNENLVNVLERVAAEESPVACWWFWDVDEYPTGLIGRRYRPTGDSRNGQTL